MGNAIYKGWWMDPLILLIGVRRKPTKYAEFSLFPNKRSVGYFQGWELIELGSGDDSGIWKNYSQSNINRVEPNKIVIHPSQNGEMGCSKMDSTNIRIISSDRIFGGDMGIMTYSIIHNNSTELWLKSQVYSTENFDFNVTVNKGDVIDFQVGVGWNEVVPIDIKIGDDYF